MGLLGRPAAGGAGTPYKGKVIVMVCRGHALGASTRYGYSSRPKGLCSLLYIFYLPDYLSIVCLSARMSVCMSV